MTTMQSATPTLDIEHMLESVDHLIEKHQAEPSPQGFDSRMPRLPEGCVFYSAAYEYGDAPVGWHVRLLDTTRPFQGESLVDGWDDHSLDQALLEARYKVLSARSAAGN